MTLQEFKNTFDQAQPPQDLSIFLQSLWFDGVGNWKQAHDLVDNRGGQEAAHIHAYLHRVEGDFGNARYWYNRAGQPYCEASLEQEWEQLFHKFNT